MNIVPTNIVHLRRLPRKVFQSRFTAYLLRELPAWDATPLFNSRDELAATHGNDEFRYRVHMTAVDGLMGRTHYHELANFKERNPGFRFYLWSNEANDDFMQTYFRNEPILRAYNQIKFGIVRADIVRLCLLWVYGGFYLDTKSQLRGPLDQFTFEDNVGYLLHETHKIIDADILSNLQLPVAYQLTNWFMAFSPRHQFIRAAIEEIVAQWQADYRFAENGFNAAVWQFSGPKMITRVANRLWPENPQIEIVSCFSQSVGPIYACRGSWVRTLIRPHYSQKGYVTY